jgi:hypothetical protein
MLFHAILIGLAFTQIQSPGTATSCHVRPPSIIAVSPAGVAQVSNLALIQVEAIVPRRPIPASGVLQGLRAEALVYQMSPTGTRSEVASVVNVSGGAGDQATESALFYLSIPVKSSERDAAIREYIMEVTAQAPPDSRERAQLSRVAALVPEMLVGLFRQHRIGSFRVLCRVLDGDRLLGSGEVPLEVVFKGLFFNQAGFR